MTRSAAFSLARQRVKETGKPWLVVLPRVDGSDFFDALERRRPALDDVGLNGAALDWIVQGAESGQGARLMEIEWARWTRDRCQAAEVAFFLKQTAVRGRKIPTPELDGRTWVEMPGGGR